MSTALITILSFLEDIGINYQLAPILESTFLPGLRLSEGILVIDIPRLISEGDILHEAGHLACMPSDIRQTMSNDLEDGDLHQGGELMAIAWSYAAVLFLGLDPELVFHQGGYKGDGKNIIQNFSEGNYIGLPLLQWSGMCFDQSTAAAMGVKPFPHMLSWTCKKRDCAGR